MKTLLTGLILLAVLIWCACDEGNPVEPTTETTFDPPEDLFGVPAYLGDRVSMLLMWKPPAKGGAPPGYDVYRSVDGNDFTVINTTVVTSSPFGPDSAAYPEALYFADTTYDTTSALVHKYYVVSTGGFDEIDPPDTVSCIPSTINRATEVSGISPTDDALGVDRVPSFGWDAMDSTESFVLFLKEAEDNYPLWMYRVADIGCTFKTTSGTTYLDDSGDTLESIHEYTWLVWAISSDNCGFAFSESSFTTTYATVVATVVNREHQAGAHVACWDQTGDDTLQVPQGKYTVYMVSNEVESFLGSFEIDDDAVHVGSSCDPPVTIPPVENLYRTGDLIPISYSIPEAATVRIDMVQ